MHVRTLPMYVCFRRTYSGNQDSGLRSRDRGVGTTQNTPDLMKKIPLARSGLRLAPKIYDWHFDVYNCDVENKIQFSCYISQRIMWYPLFRKIPPEFLLELGYRYTLLFNEGCETLSRTLRTFREHFEHSRTFANYCNCYVMAIE